MKSYAYYYDSKTKEEKIVSAFEAVMIREFEPERFSRLSFSYKYGEKSFSVIPKYNSKTQTAFFAFEKGSDFPSDAGSGETLSHYAAKTALSSMKSIHLVDDKSGLDIIISPSRSECEKQFLFDNEYFCDVFIEFDRNGINDKKYYYKWDGKIALEVEVTHKTDEEKAKDFEKNEIPIFEIRISKAIKNTVDFKSEKSIDDAVGYMKRLFKNQVYGRLISDAETEEYRIMSRYKEEIEQFKAARDKAEKEYLEAKEKAEKAKAELKSLERELKHPVLSKLKKKNPEG